jgi:hypothetical protein
MANVHTYSLLSMSPKRRYTFWINGAEAEGLKRVKAEEGIAESEQIRQAIRDWLRKKRAAAAREASGSPRKRV